ncbi:MAG: hypothetical protein RR346_03860 [Bacteroidales bacterium]
MFRNIVKEWAMRYRPIRHNAATNKRFFECDGIADIMDLLQGVRGQGSPFVVIDTSIDGRVINKLFRRSYGIYFFVKNELSGRPDAVSGQEEAKELALKTALRFLWRMRKEKVGIPISPGCVRNDIRLKHVRVDEPNIQIQGIGPFVNNYWGAWMVIDVDSPVAGCDDLSEDLYEPI